AARHALETLVLRVARRSATGEALAAWRVAPVGCGAIGRAAVGLASVRANRRRYFDPGAPGGERCHQDQRRERERAGRRGAAARSSGLDHALPVATLGKSI